MFPIVDPQTLFVGRQRLYFPAVDSTNNYLKQLIREKDYPEGLSVLTDYQTSGRGQVGNRWQSEIGKNILVSVYFKPTSWPADRYFFLNMSVCLAISDTLNVYHAGFQVKWPNDILFNQRKLGGVLIENTVASNKLRHVVAGIGLNINQTRFGPEVENAISLMQITGEEVSRGSSLGALFKNLEARYLQVQSQPEAIKHSYLQNLYGYQAEVLVEVDGQSTEAAITDVQPDGTLVVQINNELREFRFKEIVFKL